MPAACAPPVDKAANMLITTEARAEAGETIQRRRWGTARPTQIPAVSSEVRRRRWGPTDNADDAPSAGGASDFSSDPSPPTAAVSIKVAVPSSADIDLLVGNASSAVPRSLTTFESAVHRIRRLTGEKGGVGLVRFAQELFHPKTAVLSFDNRFDSSALGQTSCVKLTRKLSQDFTSIGDGHAVYWPACLCEENHLAIFDALKRELPWKSIPYRRGHGHPACVDEDELLSSPTYRYVVAVLRQIFRIRVGYSIVHLYANGQDWTEYHRDKFSSDGNRMKAASICPVPQADGSAVDILLREPEAHNVTVGVSFGAERELRFKHLETGLEFGFPQRNGDVFAFTTPVNTAFQHCIPQKMPMFSVGPRISVILWGCTEAGGLLSCLDVPL